jgi:hypothetical protein
VSQDLVDDGNSTTRPKSNFIGRQFPDVSAPCRFARQRLGVLFKKKGRPVLTEAPESGLLNQPFNTK